LGNFLGIAGGAAAGSIAGNVIADRMGGGNVASQLPAERPGVGGERPNQLPAERPGAGGERPSQLPSERPGIADRPGGGERPSQLPSGPGSGNRPGGGERPSQLPSGPGIGNRPGGGGPGGIGGERPGIGGERPGNLPSRPQDRPNWGDWSGDRNGQWQDRVNNANNSWNSWKSNKQTQLNNFRGNQQQRWNNLEGARNDAQNWRDQNREDWQNHRNEMWDYRSDRAEQVWDNAQDFYNDCFDDHWWGHYGWGHWAGHYYDNPWWWWAPAAVGAVTGFVDAVIPDPVYVDYGMNVVYEGQTVYVDNQPMPVEQYVQPVIDLAVNVEQPPPPLPPEEGKQAEWMPLGVYSLVQEEQGDPIMFLQLSVNRAGMVSGAYQNVLTNDQRQVAGQVDKNTQRVAWRLGDNMETIFETSLGNLTLDVAPIAVHFGTEQTQTWLLVRLPEPAPVGKPPAIPDINRKPPPLNKAAPAPKK
jgi:hypothetical protein